MRVRISQHDLVRSTTALRGKFDVPSVEWSEVDALEYVRLPDHRRGDSIILYGPKPSPRPSFGEPGPRFRSEIGALVLGGASHKGIEVSRNRGVFYPTSYKPEGGWDNAVLADGSGGRWHIDSGSDECDDDVLTTDDIKPRDEWHVDWPEEADAVRVETDEGQLELHDFEEEDESLPDQITPCSYYDIRSCSCCVCPNPECGAKSIRARKSKEPTYACANCDHEFETPAAAEALLR